MPISYPFKPLSGSRKEKAKYGVLLTLETTEANEMVHYHEIDSSIDSIKFYWNFESNSNLGNATHDNYYQYPEPGEHKLLVLSDTDLQFPQHTNYEEQHDISQHLIQIDKFQECKPLLIKEDTGCYFAEFGKLRKININEIFDQNINITNFSYCFYKCKKLEEIPAGLFDKYKLVTDFTCCFSWCEALTKIPAGLFAENEQVTSFSNCFSVCTGLTEIPATLFDNNKLVNDFTGCFLSCTGITSNVPDLWNTHRGVVYKTMCFYNCINAKNYLSIPADWKQFVLP